MLDYEKYMQRAMALAEKGRGRTSPNPMVGALIIQGEEVVGEGFHARAGDAHAEINALHQAGERARGATMIVTLEPCPNWGRTPPCTQAIAEAGISKVVVGMLDPNPNVRGRGIEELKKAGIQVEQGFLKEEIKNQNEAYIKYITTGIPFVLLKMAMSLDGKVATKTGSSRWISSEASRQLVHQLRDEYDAVMVGIGTILKDNPRLDVRLVEGEASQPLRVIVDTQGRVPLNSWVVETATEIPTLVATTERISFRKIRELERKDVEVLVLSETNSKVNLQELLAELGKREVISILLEGGPTLSTSMINQRLIDKLLLFISPKLLGGKEAPTLLAGEGVEEVSEAQRLSIRKVKMVGEDLMIEVSPVQVEVGQRADSRLSVKALRTVSAK